MTRAESPQPHAAPGSRDGMRMDCEISDPAGPPCHNQETQMDQEIGMASDQRETRRKGHVFESSPAASNARRVHYRIYVRNRMHGPTDCTFVAPASHGNCLLVKHPPVHNSIWTEWIGEHEPASGPSRCLLLAAGLGLLAVLYRSSSRYTDRRLCWSLLCWEEKLLVSPSLGGWVCVSRCRRALQSSHPQTSTIPPASPMQSTATLRSA